MSGFTHESGLALCMQFLVSRKTTRTLTSHKSPSMKQPFTTKTKKPQIMNSSQSLLPRQALPSSSDSAPEQQAQLDDLLAKYKDMFVTYDDELGYTEHKIFTTDDIPVNQPFRRISPRQYQEAKKHIQKLLKQGIIHESHSPY